MRENIKNDYVSAVAALEKLSLDEQQRAYGEAAKSSLEEYASKRLGKKARGPAFWQKLIGKRGSCLDPLLPADDHMELRNGLQKTYVSQPYEIEYDDLKGIVEHCDANGLQARITGLSWHAPGKTISVEYTQRPN